ncbi:MAG: hypothetical protein A2901_07585 [Elusimicrobia bacterium RIFCSPLOWO2_01_FULL_54_10]|nr:MAG: hypothetical protein A2901_07585 [Elusimicrobia bacterium RIFCSPLOWO2_01_FULL_54_10]
MKCPACSKQIDDDSVYCDLCGSEVASKIRERNATSFLSTEVSLERVGSGLIGAFAYVIVLGGNLVLVPLSFLIQSSIFFQATRNQQIGLGFIPILIMGLFLYIPVVLASLVVYAIYLASTKDDTRSVKRHLILMLINIVVLIFLTNPIVCHILAQIPYLGLMFAMFQGPM